MWCPQCNSSDVVRNGKVRRTQRYLCCSCKRNFSNQFKRRWPRDSKLINLLLLQSGEDMDEVAKGCGATSQTVERWLLDAMDLKPWFVDSLVDALMYYFIVKGESLDDSVNYSLWLYCHITKDESVDGIERALAMITSKLEGLSSDAPAYWESQREDISHEERSLPNTSS